MKKVVINDDYGGYSLSDTVLKMYLKLSDTPYTIYNSGYYEHIIVDDQPFTADSIRRDDPILVELLEDLGWVKKGLKIVVIPEFASYSIGEYDGKEWIDNTWINVSVNELRAGLSEERIRQARRVDFIKLGPIERT